MKIKLEDYERIYKTINTILLNENADPTIACTFFSFYAASILSNHYKINAQPVAGLCLYHLGNNNILTFGEIKNNLITSSENAFHCWVIADGWLIDFMAPTFPTLLKTNHQQFSCLPKMMQKPISSMSSSAHALKAEGDFYFEINPQVIENRIAYLSSRIAYKDLEKICQQWYQKPPKKMQKQIHIGNGKGKMNTVSLIGQSVVGIW